VGLQIAFLRGSRLCLALVVDNESVVGPEVNCCRRDLDQGPGAFLVVEPMRLAMKVFGSRNVKFSEVATNVFVIFRAGCPALAGQLAVTVICLKDFNNCHLEGGTEGGTGP